MMKHKIKQALWSLGISKPLLNIRRGIHNPDKHSLKFGGNSSKLQFTIRNIFFDTIDKLSFITYKPYILIIVSLIMLLISFLRKDIFFLET